MTTDVEALIKRLRFDANDVRNYYISTIANRIEGAADALRSQAELITRLKSMTEAQEQLIREHILAQRAAEEKAAGLAAQCALLAASLAQEEKRAEVLESARIAYASEFEPDEEGLPDVGNIHANIRTMKAKCAQLERDAGRYRWSIALEDNAEQLYAAVMSCGPKAHESIGIEIDAHIAAQAVSKEGE